MLRAVSIGNEFYDSNVSFGCEFGLRPRLKGAPAANHIHRMNPQSIRSSMLVEPSPELHLSGAT